MSQTTQTWLQLIAISDDLIKAEKVNAWKMKMILFNILKTFITEPAKHLYKLFNNREYLRYHVLVARYAHTPRFVERELRIGKMKLTVPDVASFLAAYHEIFVEEIYAFRSKEPNPVILDCGANIGVSILYFKKIYPECRIVGYEADPHIFSILEKNVSENGLRNVELINKGVWTTDGGIEFGVEGADAGRVGISPFTQSIQIPTEAFHTILSRQDFDFIKLDIEGAETDVLLSGEIPLERCSIVFVEFHSFYDRPQQLGKIIALFESKGFRVHVHPPFISPSPFLSVNTYYGMDMQLNLFFWKE